MYVHLHIHTHTLTCACTHKQWTFYTFCLTNFTVYQISLSLGFSMRHIPKMSCSGIEPKVTVEKLAGNIKQDQSKEMFYFEY